MYLIILLLSIWQSILFWNKEPGISVMLFIIPSLFLLVKYLEKKGKIKNKKAKLIGIPIILISITYFIYNNEFFNTINTLVLPILLITMIIELFCDKFTLEKAISNVFAFLFKPLGYFGVVVKNILNKIRKKEEDKTLKPRNIKRIVKALFISIPILFLVFVLLVTADSEFLKLFINVIKFLDRIRVKIEVSDIFERIFVIILMFFYMAGFIENAILTNEIEKSKNNTIEKDNLSVKLILALLNIMYIVFCIIQIKSLINIYSMNKKNIDYSYYARQGFFQLMVVSAINLFMILKSKKKCYKEEKFINIMDLLMIILTTVILISSFIRMYLYEQSYGFTLKRVLVFWAEITEGILLIPTALYVLDKKINLAKAYFITITSMYVILNFANINRIIAKKNVEMYLEKGTISGMDVYHLIGLGTDALPETVKILNIEEVPNQIEENPDFYHSNVDFARKELNEIYDNLNNKKASWQEFNISKNKAIKILEEKL